MDPNERQIATELTGIRKDHRARYELAAKRLKGKVVDAACGVGYGSWILAEAGCTVRRFDLDADAVAYAREHWSHDNIVETYQADAMAARFPDGRAGYDAVIAFEMLEHLEDPLQALRNFREMAPTLLASVPNEAVWPWQPGYLLHHRHYTAREFEELLNKAGYEVTHWWGQEGPYSEPVEDTQGRTLIAEAVAVDEPRSGMFKRLPDAEDVPESVAIVAMGASKDTYAALLSNVGGDRKKLWDEVWAINAMGGVIHHDRLYHMDDIRIQEVRAEANKDHFVGGMLKWMKTTDKPIYTCRVYDDYPMTRDYPLKFVLDSLGVPYLNTTVAYAVAHAIAIGVKRLCLYGVDFSYPNLHKREKGRGCVEFLLGMAAARGLNIELAQNTTLMDANESSDHALKIGDALYPAHIYGYDTEHLTLTRDENGWTIERRDRERIPTAQEMEQRYAHVPVGEEQKEAA